MLIEGQIYLHGDQELSATFLLGAWILRRVDSGAVPLGDVAAYRQMPDGWRECRFAPTVAGEELVYGSTVELGALEPVADTDVEEFAAIMAEMAWEWA